MIWSEQTLATKRASGFEGAAPYQDRSCMAAAVSAMASTSPRLPLDHPPRPYAAAT